MTAPGSKRSFYTSKVTCILASQRCTFGFCIATISEDYILVLGSPGPSIILQKTSEVTAQKTVGSDAKPDMQASTSKAVAHNAPLPPSQASAGRSSRIAPHSHIKGLGLSNEGLASTDGAGFVGQDNAREVCLVCCAFAPFPPPFTSFPTMQSLQVSINFLNCRFIGMRGRCRPHKISKILRSRAALSGRAWDRQNRLGSRHIAGAGHQSAVLSDGGIGGVQHRGEEDRSTGRGVQTGNRYATRHRHIWLVSEYVLSGLRIKETKEVYEGEVTELTPAESENPLSGYGKTIAHVIVGLKTVSVLAT
jgi:hypothetical protein